MTAPPSRIIRVFPSKTTATPDDELAYTGLPDLFAQADKVHISVTFTWDIPKAEKLAEAWKYVAPVEVGGVAYNQPGGEFVPGMYLKYGHVITSRGCPNHCWFCSVPKREGTLRELPIRDGWIVDDDNLLACSENHIRSVFEMLKRQPKRPIFAGGLEAARLQDWHIDLLLQAKTSQMFFAYDTPDDYEPLVNAAMRLRAAGFTRNKLYAYVLIGYPKDTMNAAEMRLKQVRDLGITPFAMLYRDKGGKYDPDWRRFQRLWCRPAAIYAKNRPTTANLPPSVIPAAVNQSSLLHWQE